MIFKTLLFDFVKKVNFCPEPESDQVLPLKSDPESDPELPVNSDPDPNPELSVKSDPDLK